MKARIIQTGAFLGKAFHNRLLAKSEKLMGRFAPSTKQFPVQGPRDFFWPRIVEVLRTDEYKRSEAIFRIFLESELTNYALLFAADEGGVLERTQAQAMDCYLYAQDNKYIKKSGNA